MQRFTKTSYYNDNDMIFVSSSLGGVIDFDRHDSFENMLRKIIVVPEYTRMSKIQQLGFLENVIPTANHTRYEHCVGAFDLMRSLIYFSNRNWGRNRVNALKFNKKEQVAQTAALLHDLGHAFPGHPFERAIENIFPESFKSHEQWGTEILCHSGIYDILNSYDSGFADRVLAVMAEDDLPNSIWQQIHCGNLNVDTMDYIHRDQSHVIGKQDVSLIRRIIENVKFGRNSMGQDALMLYPGAEEDFIKMLQIRGDMYANVYLNGTAASAQEYLTDFFTQIQNGLEMQKYRNDILKIQNPYVEFIKSRGTDINSYLKLTSLTFYDLVQQLGNSQLGDLSKFANKYRDISSNFSSFNFYKGSACNVPSENEIQDMKDRVENKGGIFRDVTVPLYNTKKPEIYCIRNEYDQLEKFSKLYPNIANEKIRIISGFNTGNRTR